MRRVSKIQVLQGYHLDLTFDDGARGVADLSDLVGKGCLPVGKTLMCSSRFGSVQPANCYGAIKWISVRTLCA